ncbi:MFS transporter [Alicyclobacillus ferrooxydans]|uniref:MFS transporter n=1 Tax=Alicyclobacillus ferrooxydans TaxID=471514 RepID=A0A0P9CQB1_9BACL|nr:MFS transporter [Alicyclobacillus ferrooxydans]KPV45083.1 MFS transporter [Alicyclobacillus ferrooxydans]
MIPFSKRLAYTVNQIGVNLLWQAFNTVAVFYYVTVLHVSTTGVSVGMIVYGVVNAFLNLFAGYLSDRTNSRMGRRIPYIVYGGVPFVVLFYLLFHPLVSGPHALLAYFLVVTFLFDISFTFVALNISALFPEMYPNASNRSSVVALQQFFGIIGLIAGVALSKSLGQSLGWTTMALIFAAITFVSVYLSLYGSFENPAYREEPLHFREAVRETFSNKRFLVYVFASLFVQLTTTMFVTISSFYSTYVVSLNATQSALFLGLMFIVAIPVSFLWSRVALKLGNSRTTLAVVVLFALISLVFCFDTTPLAVILTGAVLGIGIAGFMVLMNLLLADVIDYDAEKTGKRREGMYYGMNGFVVRIGLSLQYAIMGIFFTVTKFNSNLRTQPHAAILGLRFLIGGLPVILLFVSFLLLYKYHRYVSDERGEKRVSHAIPS